MNGCRTAIRTMTHLLMCPQHQTGGRLAMKCLDALRIWLSVRERGTMKPLGRLALSWKLSLAVHKRQPSVQWHLSVSSSQSDGALKNCIP